MSGSVGPRSTSLWATQPLTTEKCQPPTQRLTVSTLFLPNCSEGHDTLDKIDKTMADPRTKRPLRPVRILHTVVLDAPEDVLVPAGLHAEFEQEADEGGYESPAEEVEPAGEMNIGMDDDEDDEDLTNEQRARKNMDIE